MDNEKTENLKKRLAQIKNVEPEVEESPAEKYKKYKGVFTLATLFLKSTVFWLTLNQLSAKFPSYIVPFGYWETVLYTLSLILFAYTFKSNKK